MHLCPHICMTFEPLSCLSVQAKCTHHVYTGFQVLLLVLVVLTYRFLDGAPEF